MSDRDSPEIDVPILAVWLFVQCGALALSAAGVPLTARFVKPPESVAVQVLLVVQHLIAALLMPRLLHARTGVVASLVVLPFTLLAGLLSHTPVLHCAACAVTTIAWLQTMQLWRGMLRSSSATMIGVAGALSVTLLGPLMLYLRAETEGIDKSASTFLHWLTPLNASISLSHGLSTAPFAQALILLGASLTCAIAHQRFRAKLSTRLITDCG